MPRRLGLSPPFVEHFTYRQRQRGAHRQALRGCAQKQACAAVRQLALPRSARKARRWSPPPPRALAMLKAVASAEVRRCNVRIGAGLSRTVRHFCVCVTAQAPACLRDARAGQCRASTVCGAAAARWTQKSARDAATGLRLAQPSAPRYASLLARHDARPCKAAHRAHKSKSWSVVGTASRRRYSRRTRAAVCTSRWPARLAALAAP
jgi:hypothetical protein